MTERTPPKSNRALEIRSEADRSPVALEQIADTKLRIDQARSRIIDLHGLEEGFASRTFSYPHLYQPQCGGNRGYKDEIQSVTFQINHLEREGRNLIYRALAGDRARDPDLDTFIKSHFRHLRLADWLRVDFHRRGAASVTIASSFGDHLPQIIRSDDQLRALRLAVRNAKADCQDLLYNRVEADKPTGDLGALGDMDETRPSLFEVGLAHREVYQARAASPEFRQRLESRANSYNRFDPEILPLARDLTLALDREILATHLWRDTIHRIVVSEPAIDDELTEFVRAYYDWLMQSDEYTNPGRVRADYGDLSSFAPRLYDYEGQLLPPPSLINERRPKWLGMIADTLQTESPTLFSVS